MFVYSIVQVLCFALLRFLLRFIRSNRSSTSTSITQPVNCLWCWSTVWRQRRFTSYILSLYMANKCHVTNVTQWQCAKHKRNVWNKLSNKKDKSFSAFGFCCWSAAQFVCVVCFCFGKTANFQFDMFDVIFLCGIHSNGSIPIIMCLVFSQHYFLRVSVASLLPVTSLKLTRGSFVFVIIRIDQLQLKCTFFSGKWANTIQMRFPHEQ